MELLIVGEKERQRSIEQRAALARELGHKEILLLFQKDSKDNQELIKKIREDAAPRVESAILISTQNQAKSLRKNYDHIIAPCKREFFENKNVDFILEPESGSRKDFIHHRNSGLNQVLLKLCQATSKREAKGIIATLSLLRGARRPSEILGRMLQNARWCEKYKVAYHVTSGARTAMEQRSAPDLAALKRTVRQA